MPAPAILCNLQRKSRLLTQVLRAVDGDVGHLHHGAVATKRLVVGISGLFRVSHSLVSCTAQGRRSE
ncbi:hypothetical protein HYQ46_000011 [Verticillium longisporum]|nr:hypothetical protein HYQ46_000011 [Verticillium longisporum]